MSDLKSTKAYKELLETFRKYIPNVRNAARTADDQYLLSTFQPVFKLEAIDSLKPEDINRFTSFKENKHWNGIHRQNSNIMHDFDGLKKGIKILLDESLPIAERIKRVRSKSEIEHIDGLGFAVITGILITAYPDKYPVLNNKVISAMKMCDIYPFKGEGKDVERYIYMIDLCNAIKSDTGLSFLDIDSIWHHIITDRPTIFKHSPGTRGSDYNKQHADSVVAIGWNSCGPLNEYYEENEFQDAAAKAIELGDGKDQSYIKKQYSCLMDMNDHDVIMYYKEGKVIGVASVVGEDYEYKSGEQHAHRRKVKFLNNFTEHTIKNGELVRFFSFTNTLNPLEPKLYETLMSELKESNPSIEWEKVLKIKTKKKKVHEGFDGFSEEAFNILSSFKETPHYTEYQRLESQFKKELKTPLQALFEGLKSPFEIIFGNKIETSKRVLANLKKNDYGRGGIYSHYWGAFYSTETKRSSSSQMYIMIKDDSVSAGFGFGDNSEQFKDRLSRNTRNNSEFFEEYLEVLVKNDFKYKVDKEDDGSEAEHEGIITPSKILTFVETKKRISFFKTNSKEKVLQMQGELFDEVNEVFKLLIPMFALATFEEPEKYIEKWRESFDYLESEDEVEETIISSNYTWESFLQKMNWKENFSEAKNIKYCLGDFENQSSPKRNLILVGPPGTGKSYCAEHLAALITNKPKNIYQVQFHQSYSYENFIQGIRPVTGKDGNLSYEVYTGPFVEFCKRAVSNPKENFVFIIDEINRGNLSRIFGELMFLLEYPNKNLPLLYDQKIKLTIPKNAYLIGTMNSSDRSIALVDYALRRRFRFVEVDPRSEVIESFYESTNEDSATILNFYKKLNDKIASFDKRLAIGHSYLMREESKSTGITKDELRMIWDTEIYPLLSEYFSNSPNQLALFTFEIIWKESLPASELRQAS